MSMERKRMNNITVLTAQENIVRLYSPYSGVIFDNVICQGTGVVVGLTEIGCHSGSNWTVLILYDQIQWKLPPSTAYTYPVIQMNLYDFDCNGTVSINVKRRD